jgi:cytochrome b6-f complex iron-sulfur subunit
MAPATAPKDITLLEDGIASPSRRDFLRAAGLTCGAGLLWVAGCNAGDEQKAAVKIEDIVPQTWRFIEATPVTGGFQIKDAQKLQAGAAVAFVADEMPVVVFSAGDGKLRALSAKCTHAGCQVEWRGTKTKERLHCPCHSSQFDEDGTVLGGPAKAPLQRYSIDIQGADAIVKLA